MLPMLETIILVQPAVTVINHLAGYLTLEVLALTFPKLISNSV